MELDWWAWVLIIGAVVLAVIALIVYGVYTAKTASKNKDCYHKRRKEWSVEYLQDLIRLGFLSDRVKKIAKKTGGDITRDSDYMNAVEALKASGQGKAQKCNEWFINRLMQKGKDISMMSKGFGDNAAILIEAANDALGELDAEYDYKNTKGYKETRAAEIKRAKETKHRRIFRKIEVPEAFEKALPPITEPVFVDVSDKFVDALTPRQIIEPPTKRRKVKKVSPIMGAAEQTQFGTFREEEIPVAEQDLFKEALITAVKELNETPKSPPPAEIFAPTTPETPQALVPYQEQQPPRRPGQEHSRARRWTGWFDYVLETLTEGLFPETMS